MWLPFPRNAICPSLTFIHYFITKHIYAFSTLQFSSLYPLTLPISSPLLKKKSASAMDDLVKGLINVALDHVRGGDDNRDDRDERSRSSWAQVSADPHTLSLCIHVCSVAV